MAKVTDVNNAVSTGSEAVFLLKEMLKSIGWTVPQSSDGTTYNAASDEISHAGSGAGGMDNTRAWFVIVDPDGGRSFCFQKTATHYQWRIKYSALDGFTGGSPAATVTPSASDEGILVGGGTDASPSWGSMWPSSVPPGRWHIVAQDTANANGVWGFWAFQTDASMPVQVSTAIFCEPMEPASHSPLVGTRAAPTTGDPDPCVVGAFLNGVPSLGTGASGSAKITGTGSEMWGWFCMNGTNGQAESFVQMAAATPHFDNSPGSNMYGLGPSPYDSKDELLPVWVGRGYSSALGLKGSCQYLRKQIAGRYYPDTVDLASDSYVCLDGGYALPWEDGTVPLV